MTDPTTNDWTTRLALPAELGLLSRIVRATMLVTEALEQIAARHGTTLADYLVLGVVRRAPRSGTTPTAICDVLGRTSGGMTLTLDRLERAGWLRRRPDPHDRRRVFIQLTAQGRALGARINEELHTWENSLVLSERERRTCERALALLIGATEGTR